MDPELEGNGSAAAGEEDAELITLKENLRLALVTQGALGKARAMLRAATANVLRGDAPPKGVRPLDPSLSLAYAVVEDFLLSQGLGYTHGVFDSEVSLSAVDPDRVGADRSKLAGHLGVSTNQPVLLSLLSGDGEPPATGRSPAAASSSSPSPSPDHAMKKASISPKMAPKKIDAPHLSELTSTSAAAMVVPKAEGPSDEEEEYQSSVTYSDHSGSTDVGDWDHVEKFSEDAAGRTLPHPLEADKLAAADGGSDHGDYADDYDDEDDDEF